MLDFHKRNIELFWQVGHSSSKIEKPEKFVKASVPGAVQKDWLPQLEHSDWHYNDNVRQFDWMEDKFWFYQARFQKPELMANQKLVFMSKGVDYHYEVIVNNQRIYRHEGMFTPFELDLTAFLKEQNELQVNIYPTPKSSDVVARFQVDESVKPAVSYGWDWHPRLIPLGIWGETKLQIKSKEAITSLEYAYELSEDLKTAQVMVSADCGAGVDHLVLEIADREGNVVLSKQSEQHDGHFEFDELFDPEHLWWPYELGDPYLYQCTLRAMTVQSGVLDIKTWSWGFRRSKLIMNEGAWVEPTGFPKTRSVAPITLEINGQRLFAKGTNWVNPEVFPGTITDDRYRILLEHAKEMHFNLLRIWGGGIVNKAYFHDWCDANGMMVWQEFPLSCCKYTEKKSYLQALNVEGTSIVKRLRNNPSTVMWCGGNELFNNWSGLTDQHKGLRLLNSICITHDPNTPFLATSPLFGMGHGHYLFWDENTREDVFSLMSKSSNTAYTEFGMPSPSSLSTLKKVIPEEELRLPIPETSAWITHHALKAWTPEAWISEDIIKRYYPDTNTVEDLVANGQELQAIGYRGIYEMARQQWPYCSMALNWCFNEPWPSAANNSIIQFDGTVKPCFEAIKTACRPVMASARFASYQWMKGHELSFQLFFFNHAPATTDVGEVIVWINDKKVLVWPIGEMESYQNAVGADIKYLIAKNEEKLNIRLETKAKEWDAFYELQLVESTKDEGVMNL